MNILKIIKKKILIYIKLLLEIVVKLLQEETFYSLDTRGVRAFVRYSTATGKWSIECYRSKREDESKGEMDWEMIREGHVQSYSSRKEAEERVLELAKQICKQNKF